MSGKRLFFWLQPDRRALTDIGYASGVVLAFSTNTPNTRRSIADSGRQRGLLSAGLGICSVVIARLSVEMRLSSNASGLARTAS